MHYVWNGKIFYRPPLDPAVRCWPWGIFSSWLASRDLRYSALQLLGESGACGFDSVSGDDEWLVCLALDGAVHTDNVTQHQGQFGAVNQVLTSNGTLGSKWVWHRPGLCLWRINFFLVKYFPQTFRYIFICYHFSMLRMRATPSYSMHN